MTEKPQFTALYKKPLFTAFVRWRGFYGDDCEDGRAVYVTTDEASAQAMFKKWSEPQEGVDEDGTPYGRGMSRGGVDRHKSMWDLVTECRLADEWYFQDDDLRIERDAVIRLMKEEQNRKKIERDAKAKIVIDRLEGMSKYALIIDLMRKHPDKDIRDSVSDYAYDLGVKGIYADGFSILLPELFSERDELWTSNEDAKWRELMEARGKPQGPSAAYLDNIF